MGDVYASDSLSSNDFDLKNFLDVFEDCDFPSNAHPPQNPFFSTSVGEQGSSTKTYAEDTNPDDVDQPFYPEENINTPNRNRVLNTSASQQLKNPHVDQSAELTSLSSIEEQKNFADLESKQQKVDYGQNAYSDQSVNDDLQPLKNPVEPRPAYLLRFSNGFEILLPGNNGQKFIIDIIKPTAGGCTNEISTVANSSNDQPTTSKSCNTENHEESVSFVDNDNNFSEFNVETVDVHSTGNTPRCRNNVACKNSRDKRTDLELENKCLSEYLVAKSAINQEGRSASLAAIGIDQRKVVNVQNRGNGSFYGITEWLPDTLPISACIDHMGWEYKRMYTTSQDVPDALELCEHCSCAIQNEQLASNKKKFFLVFPSRAEIEAIIQEVAFDEDDQPALKRQRSTLHIGTLTESKTNLVKVKLDFGEDRFHRALQAMMGCCHSNVMTLFF